MLLACYKHAIVPTCFLCREAWDWAVKNDINPLLLVAMHPRAQILALDSNTMLMPGI
jgi:hypothetical protein